MTDPRTLNEWLGRFTYKPGWRIWIDADYFQMERPLLRISYMGVDAVTGKGAPQKIQTVADLGMVRTYAEFRHVLRLTIEGLEMHELKEWFKEDGVCVVDPHPETKEKAA